MSTAGPAPSTIVDVCKYVVALLVQCGEADYPHVDGSGLTEILVGERHLEENGASHRILFIIDQEDGKVGPVLEIGARQVGSWARSCTCYVWGTETLDDFERVRQAENMLMRLVACFVEAGVGRLDFRNVKRLQATNITTYGEDYRFTVGYEHEIPADDAVNRAARALGLTGQSPPNPDQPNGPTGKTFGVNVVMENNRQ